MTHTRIKINYRDECDFVEVGAHLAMLDAVISGPFARCFIAYDKLGRPYDDFPICVTQEKTSYLFGVVLVRFDYLKTAIIKHTERPLPQVEMPLAPNLPSFFADGEGDLATFTFRSNALGVMKFVDKLRHAQKWDERYGWRPWNVRM